jgi:hypothetical protein
LQAVHTPNLPALLRSLGASLLVTTDQVGKLVMVRDEGDHPNTHFRGFQAPMGMTLSGGWLAISTARGLSMPHSPPWYGGRLWVCESGSGTHRSIDQNTGKREAPLDVPGLRSVGGRATTYLLPPKLGRSSFPVRLTGQMRTDSRVAHGGTFAITRPPETRRGSPAP